MMAQPRDRSERSWISRHPFLLIGLIIIVSLGPFANKAIQTDDALFVWTGQWIQHHPLDFLGGKTNWWLSTVPMWMANWNPPLLSYFFAVVASIFGWTEIPLHVVTMGFAFAAAAGIYSLAKMWCGRPLLATIIAIFTPAFLVSSNTLMCDVPMLAFWVWSVVVFEAACAAASLNWLPAELWAVADEHLRPTMARSNWLFVLAGLLAGLAILTKYSAMMLLPLLAAMGVLRLRKPGWWLIALIVPVIFIACYELLTAKLYGHGLIFASERYARAFQYAFPGGHTAKMMIALSFAGGSFLPVLFLAPWLWHWRTWVIGGTAILGGLIGAFALYNPGVVEPWYSAGWDRGGFRLEVALLVTAGVQLILIAAVDLWHRRDPGSIALFLWMIGVFFFAGVLNWGINARSFLPACPVAAILTVRRLEISNGMFKLPLSLVAPISFAVFVGLSLVFADFQTANAMRSFARHIATKYRPDGHQLWIEGHAGFQYYLQVLGGKSVDIERSTLMPGDVVAVCWNTGNNVPMAPGTVGTVDAFQSDPASWMNLSGQNEYGVAGFYGADVGPVPFVIGKWKQSFFIAKVLSNVQYRGRPANERAVAQNGAVPEFQGPGWHIEPEPTSPENPVVIKQLQTAAQFEQNGQETEAIQWYQKALDLDTTNAEALNNLAWLLATANNPDLRDGSRAVQLAFQAVKMTEGRQPVMIGTLAAAFAENGDFPKALISARVAHDLAQLTGQTEVMARNQELMDLYARGRTVSSLRSP
ncbi:MAG TPA: glycosyltransferase family 39 protein [Alphaproteobacteria bacterium]|nr:glycosyltransferase family 39 protein [Alphaproteobacteria bacterium]